MLEHCKNIRGLFLRAVGRESVGILSVGGDGCKSLPDGFVRGSGRGGFSGLSRLPAPRVRFSAWSIEPAGIPHGVGTYAAVAMTDE